MEEIWKGRRNKKKNDKLRKCKGREGRRGMKLSRLEKLKSIPGFNQGEFQTKLDALEKMNLKTGLFAQILVAKSMIKSMAK